MEIDCENLKSSLLQFEPFLKKESSLLKYLRLGVFDEKEIDNIITILVANLLDPDYTEAIAVCFPDILLLIVVLAVPTVDTSCDYSIYFRRCRALSRLVKYSPEVLAYSVKYFKNKPAFFEKHMIEPLKKMKTTIKNTDLDIIKCCYDLLNSIPSFYKDLWDWSIFVDQYSDTSDDMEKLYYNQVLAILFNLTPLQLKHLNKHISNEKVISFHFDLHQKLQEIRKPSATNKRDEKQIIYWKFSSNVVTNIEGILLPLYNAKIAEFYSENNNCAMLIRVDSTKRNLKNIAMGLSSRKAICLIGTVGCGKTSLIEYLAKKTGRLVPNQQFNELQETLESFEMDSKLETSANKCQKRKAVDVDASDFTGELTNNTKNGFLRIQMGDQTDSKVLLGQYRCTDVPGEFIWLPGVLTQVRYPTPAKLQGLSASDYLQLINSAIKMKCTQLAVMEGYWLLLEDLDLAPQDVCSVLSNLLENNYLSVPGYREYLKVSPGFQLFVTVRSHKSSNRAQKTTLALLEKYLYTVNISSLSRSELCQVVSANYPKLSTIANRIVDIFLVFSSGYHTISENIKNSSDENNSEYEVLPTTYIETSPVTYISNSGRLVSTRDLMKLCNRSHSMYSATSTEYAYYVFQNAVDIFCSYLPNSLTKTRLIAKIGARLGIIQSRCEYYSNDYKPDVEDNINGIKVGRSLLDVKAKNIESRKRHSDKECINENLGSKKVKLDINVSLPVLKKEKTPVFSFTREACCLLERIGVCVAQSEPVLLVGETGVGKTSCVQYLAAKTDHRLIVVNMSNQSDVSDLVGGFKPVDIGYIVAPLKQEFEVLFRSTFNASKNEKFLSNISTCYNRGDFAVLVKLMINIADTVSARAKMSDQKVVNLKGMINKWNLLNSKLSKLNSQLNNSVNISFAFITGSLVKCIQNGDWVLLDEINLASDETLECLSTILERDGSIVLLEKGELTPVKRHREFRIFACMNPRTDIGKKDLPTGIRNRFTEFFVDELRHENDMRILIGDYLKNTGISTIKISAIVKLYEKLRSLAQIDLNDGLGNRPVYSLRTLCRALTICAKNLCGSIDRNLYESFCLSFLTQLDNESHRVVINLIQTLLLSNSKAILSQEIPKPGPNFVNFEGYWIEKGPNVIQNCKEYILTDTVRENLRDVARIVSIGNLPILLQGPTSAGKTSMIEYIAKRSGNQCLRINNHEHTDLQEYIGTYISDSSGKLIFKEGLLVEAMRNGYWIILDELNLASTDILEALNRVLDDNRELFIAETQVLIKAHTKFMLFATQNPPGIYGGRKTLSRAFKNRFIELHFSEIPKIELEIILEKRCLIPKSYSEKMVKCMFDLQVNRKTTARNNYTLRDLFRWGNRYTYADKKLLQNNFYDWNQHLVDEGYLLLSAKVRSNIEIQIIEETLFKNFRKKIDLKNLYSYHENTSLVTKEILENLLSYTNQGKIIWTQNLTKMAVLTAKAIQFNEPALLVGPTGCGKTTICQIVAAIKKKNLRILNCHMHTEGADFLGGLRPCRSKNSESGTPSKLFEWMDGPLIHAMREGAYFMVDEISLAEDSVLERLNSVLEPSRTMVLAEKGGIATKSPEEFIVRAHSGFQFLATMNPGGDFGKKELSPALRNRFTEIWCEPSDSEDDLMRITADTLKLGLHEGEKDDVSKAAKLMISLVLFLKNKVEKFKFSVRDILAWVEYININKTNPRISFLRSLLYGFETLFLDSLEMLSSESQEKLLIIRRESIELALSIMENQFYEILKVDEYLMRQNLVVDNRNHLFGVEPFFIEVNIQVTDENSPFEFNAPTTKENLFRLLSALSVNKAILLEGPPGVGKTAIVENLARAIGYNIVRINLCEHTDFADLFGTDLPAEETSLDNSFSNKTKTELKSLGSFIWRDGPLLAALKAENTWILLDELNLAPQSVLEGLNAILDHRGEVYIPELNKTFSLGKKTRIFACQNPLRQGGGRKGLPQSFLNRFIKVYLNKLSTDDLLYVVSKKYKSIANEHKFYFEKLLDELHFKDGNINLFSIAHSDPIFSTSNVPNSTVFEFDLLDRMVKFSQILDQGTSNLEFGNRGGPFEVNLRDLLRWCEFLFNYETGFSLIKISSCTEFVAFKDIFNNFLLVLYERMKLVYYQRMRCEADRRYIQKVFSDVFECDSFALNALSEDISLYWTDSELFMNDIVLNRDDQHDHLNSGSFSEALTHDVKNGTILLNTQLEILKNVVECVHMEKPLILSGPSNSGKTKIIDSMCVLSNRAYETEVIEDSVMGSFQQIDLVRHLDEASRTVELVYIKMIHKLLLDQSNFHENHRKHIVKLMKLWKKYTLVFKSERSKQNQSMMSDELYIFQNRILDLQAVMDVIKSTDDYEDSLEIIENAESMLKTLQRIIAITGSLNTGGHFEWVDSKIVKCLKTGGLICLEHANLCSPAILDRLNSVFEPNGTLLMSEKGVGCDNQSEIIIKNDDFRAFLTIDPIHGELSRAMRNRCVELDLSRNIYSEDDLRHIVFINGVAESYLIDTVVKIYNSCSALSELNSFNVSHLIQFAHLLTCNKRSGLGDFDAVYYSGMEVFVHSSSTDLLGFGLDFYHNKLKDKILEECKAITPTVDCFNLENMILRPRSLSTISMIKLQFEPLFILFKNNRSISLIKKSLSNLLSNSNNIELKNPFVFTKHYIWCLYAASSLNDVSLRYTYLCRILSESEKFDLNSHDVKYLSTLNKSLYDTIRKYGTFSTKNPNIPWNSKLFPRIRGSLYIDPERHIELCLNRLLFANLFLIPVVEEKITKIDQMSAACYSMSVSSGEITDNLNNAVLLDLWPLLKKSEKILLSFINNVDLNIEKYSSLIVSHLWFNRIYNCSKQNVVENKKLNIDLIKKILLHFKWLNKYLLNVIHPSNEKDYLLDDLKKVILKFEKHINDGTHPMNTMQKKYSKLFTGFSPRYAKEQIDLHDKSHEIDEMTSLVTTFEYVDADKMKRSIRIAISEESNIVKKMLATNVCDLLACITKIDDKNKNAEKLPNEIRSYLREYIIELSKHKEETLINEESANNVFKKLRELYNTTEADYVQSTSCPPDMDLWPLKNYFGTKALLLYSMFEVNLALNEDYFNNISAYSCSSRRLVKIMCSTFYQKFITMWRSVLSHISKISQFQQFALFLENFSFQNYRSLSSLNRMQMKMMQSHCIYGLMNSWNIWEWKNAKEVLHCQSKYSGPNLINCLFPILFADNGGLKQIILKELDEWKVKLNMMRLNIWNNSALMSDQFNLEAKKLHAALIYSKKIVWEIEYLNQRCVVPTILSSEYNKHFQDLIKLLKSTQASAEELKTIHLHNHDLKQKQLLYTAAINSLVGTIELCVSTFIPHIDPVEKNRLKISYEYENLICLETILASYDLLRKVMRYQGLGKEEYNGFQTLLTLTKSKLPKLKQKVALRPEVSVYNELIEHVKHFLKVNANPETLLELIQSCLNCAQYLSSVKSDGSVEKRELTSYLLEASDILKKLELWIVNSERFLFDLKKKFSSYYNDFSEPLECSTVTAQSGLLGLKDVLTQILNSVCFVTNDKYFNINAEGNLCDTLRKTFQFPNSKQHLYTSPSLEENFMNIQNLLAHSKDNWEESEKLNLIMLNASILEIKNKLSVCSQIDDCIFYELQTVLGLWHKIWKTEEDRKRKKKIEDDCLYVNKTLCKTEDEKELELQEIEENFPISVEEFIDMVTQDSLDNTVLLKKQKQNKKKNLIDEAAHKHVAKNFIEIMEQHSRIYYYKGRVVNSSSSGVDYITPFKLKLEVFSKLLSKYKLCLNAAFDDAMFITFGFIIGLQQDSLLEISLTEENTKYSNFYKDANVSEVITCVEIMESIVLRTKEQLNLYPDHAVLLDIIRVVDKIRDFPSTSPIARFNVGFQILRQKLSQWNEVAHKKNNFRDLEAKIAEYVQRWMKMELQYWRNCLAHSFEKVQDDAYKFFAFIYNLVHEYMAENSKENHLIEIAGSLRQFIENSNYADFSIRMKLLRSFELFMHYINPDNPSKRDDIVAIFRNIQIYFNQFTNRIEDAIKSFRTPIEKKLREFVKIESYNKDLSYFSMKSNVTRVHRHLNKFLKEYENLLRGSISCIFQPKENTSPDYNLDNDKGINLRYEPKHKYYMLDTKNFLAPQKLKNIILDLPRGSASGLLSKCDKLFSTSKTVVRETINKTQYSSMIRNLDLLLSDQIETCEYLRKLVVDKSKEKSKQKAEAKHILSQKKKGLSDLYKIMAELGISYKTGLMELSLNSDLTDYTIQPFCVKTMFASDKGKKLEQNLIWLNENLDQYYAKCIFKLRMLQNVMLTPSSELGQINTDRMKGFSVDMFLLVQSQRKILGQYIRNLFDLRKSIESINVLLECSKNSDGKDWLKFDELEHEFLSLKTMFCEIQCVVEQFILLFKCVPNTQSRENMVILDATEDTEINLPQKHSEIITLLTDILIETRRNIKEMTSQEEAAFLNFNFLDSLRNESTKTIQNIIQIIDKLCSSKWDQLPISMPLKDLVNKLKFTKAKSSLNITECLETESISNELENILHSVLISLQKLYKKYEKKVEDDFNKETEKIEDVNRIAENHLKEKIHERMLSDIEDLQLREVTEKLSNVILALKYAESDREKKEYIYQLISILPILEQFYLMGEFYLCQQLGAHKVSVKMLSIMLTVFVELGTKGFCVPQEIMQDDEVGEDNANDKHGEGFGLEDGTGENDVSDKIESEDQLDDAKRPEDRKNEQESDNNCKEEKGIEMSDDFDADLQDLTKDDQDDSDKENEDDECEKQIGEAETAEEKLDDQIWGSDNEDENENDISEDEGDGGKNEEDIHNDMEANKEIDATENSGKEKEGLDATGEKDDPSKEKDNRNHLEAMQDIEEVDEEQMNQHHNNLEEPIEPEEMDLGDCNLDEENGGDEGGDDTENPFEIDKIKENMETNEVENEEASADNENDGSERSDNDSDSEPDPEFGNEQKSDDISKNNDEKEKSEELGDTNQDEKIDVDGDGDPDEREDTSDECAIETNCESKDKSSKEENVQPTEENQKNASVDQVVDNGATEQDTDMDGQDTGSEKEQIGQAENDTSQEGHQGIDNTRQTISDKSQQDHNTAEKRKGNVNEERTLGAKDKNQIEQLKTVDNLNQRKEDDDEKTTQNKSEEYHHVKEARETDLTTLDTATEDQAKNIEHHDEIVQDENQNEGNDDLKDQEKEDCLDEVKAVAEMIPEMLKENFKKPSQKTEKSNELCETVEKFEVEGDLVETYLVTRENVTTAHCTKNVLMDIASVQEPTAAETLDMQKLFRDNIMHKQPILSASEDYEMWQSISNKMATSARELCEQLRLILEPSKCTRLKGDYRTGRRINMRKIIPYLASQFRKDKIWLRRLKPSQRDYKITIAIDDSKSMHHNNSKMLTLQAISLVSQALILLESGKLSIVSFGESPNVLLHHTEQFEGPKLVKGLDFAQNQSKIAELLDFVRTANSEEGFAADSHVFENLLLIISDGRNIFSEGEQKVKNAIKLARLQRIFIVYVIIDNPENKHSILDICVPQFSSDRKTITMRSYLDTFPFPYYVIVRDLGQLPLVLSEAMRQWFELVSSEQ